MSSLFAILSMFFIVWFPTRPWTVPGRTMPTNYSALFFCSGLLVCVFAYLQGQFVFGLSPSPVHVLIRTYFHSFGDTAVAVLIRTFFHSFGDTAVNLVKCFYVVASICFGWWMRRIRPVIASGPTSGESRPRKSNGIRVEIGGSRTARGIGLQVE